MGVVQIGCSEGIVFNMGFRSGCPVACAGKWICKRWLRCWEISRGDTRLSLPNTSLAGWSITWSAWACHPPDCDNDHIACVVVQIFDELPVPGNKLLVCTISFAAICILRIFEMLNESMFFLQVLECLGAQIFKTNETELIGSIINRQQNLNLMLNPPCSRNDLHFRT